jgi:hypothetical protein
VAPLVLSPDELTCAALRDEIREDIETLGPAALPDRLVTALTMGDRGAMHHLVRYVPLRDVGPGTGAVGEPQALREIPQRLSRMKDALRNRVMDPHGERARTVLGKAVDLHSSATQRYRQSEAATAVSRMMGNRRGVPAPTGNELATGVVRR